MTEKAEDGAIDDILRRLKDSIEKNGSFSSSMRYPRALYYHLDKLRKMVGMRNIKDYISELILEHFVTVHDEEDLDERVDDSRMKHFLLLGPPGCGKSTISEMMANIICAIGFLKTPTPEILRDLEEKKDNSRDSEFFSQGDKLTSLIPTSSKSSRLYNADLKKRNLNLGGKMQQIEILTRKMREKTGLLDQVLETLDHQGSEGCPEQKEPIIPAIEKNGNIDLRLHLVETVREIRTSLDQLSKLSHTSESPRVFLDPTDIRSRTSTGREQEEIKPEADFKANYVPVSRAELIGRFVGQTAPKVRDNVAKALGGVLFIDEAYGIVNKTGENVECFSSECINMLCGYMSKYSQYFIVLMAGYTEETINAISVNRGMERRFLHTLVIDDYKPEEVGKIFIHQLGSAGLRLDPSIDITSFVVQNHKFFGTTGSNSSKMSAICKKGYSKRRFHEICDQIERRQPLNTITLEILNSSIRKLQSESDSLYNRSKNQEAPLGMYI